MNNPFMEVFKGTDVPVLLLTNNVDEICLKQIGHYKQFTFTNIETSYEEISKDIPANTIQSDPNAVTIPEDDITGFTLWLKQELAPYVNKVAISKRLKGVPAVLFGEMSSTMRMMMTMMN